MVSELNDLNERWFQSWLAKDDVTVDWLIAEDYLYVAPSGLVLDRSAILVIIHSPTYRLDHFTHSEVVFRAVPSLFVIARRRRTGAAPAGTASAAGRVPPRSPSASPPGVRVVAGAARHAGASPYPSLTFALSL